MLKEFAAVARAVSATRKKLEKERIVGDYLRSLDDAALERSVVWLAGSVFPRGDERVTGVGWSSILDAAAAATGKDAGEMAERARLEGDLGDGLSPFFPESLPGRTDPSLLELAALFDALATTAGANARINLLTTLFKRLEREEARYVIKLLVGEFRIGLQEGLVESAIAKTFVQPLAEVRRAHMFNSDLGATALLARSGTLSAARMTLFHPLGFMLAQAEEDPGAILAELGAGAVADDKYDGIRAQIHVRQSEVRIYSRTLDQITIRFPELASAAERLERNMILDGEIVAYRDRILPFATLQTRIGRRKISEALLRDAPVVFFAFDLLYVDDRPLFENPLHERLAILKDGIPRQGTIRLGYQTEVWSAEDVDRAFDAARARANEGLVVKKPNSLYTPGRRGKSWLKYKKALATLDCVVTAAEYGHGKRKGVLSDYTFAVNREGELVNIGKAYSGLTDVEIDQLTERFKSITTARHGPVHLVKPEVILEIAFDRIQESARHKSGYALRFPRIARIREDKSPEQVSTLDEVRRIYEGQLLREEGRQAE